MRNYTFSKAIRDKRKAEKQNRIKDDGSIYLELIHYAHGHRYIDSESAEIWRESIVGLFGETRVSEIEKAFKKTSGLGPVNALGYFPSLERIKEKK